MKIRKVIKTVFFSVPGAKQLVKWWRNIGYNVGKKIDRYRFQKYGMEILKNVEEVFSQNHDVIYHVDYGTLLGIVRENSFIKHDDDVDYSVYFGSITPKELYAALIDRGFDFKRCFKYEGIVTEVAFLYNKVPVDFFFVFETPDGNYSQAYNDFRNDPEGCRAHYVQRISKPRLRGVKCVKFNGVKVHLPENAEEFLEYSYGMNWRTPVTNWGWEDDNGSKRISVSGCAEIYRSAEVFI